MINHQTCKLFLIILILLSVQSLSMEQAQIGAEKFLWKEGVSELEKLWPCPATHLKEPFIRVTPEDYAEKHNKRKLVIGGGHVQNPLTVLPENYRPNKGLELRASYTGSYEYHRNEGWYTVSAETTSEFASDFVCDVNNEVHITHLTRESFWDLIWDDSSHVTVFEAPGLLEKIPTWLKPGGKYIVGIPGM